MNNRTMTTVYVDRDSISLKTRSRSGCSPQHFIILKKLTPDMPKAGYIRTVLGSGYKFEVPQGMAE